MKDTNYDGILTKTEMEAIVNQEMKDFTLVKYKVGPLSDNPTGFMGIHYKIQAVVKVKEEIKVLEYFGKKIPEDVPSHNEYARKIRAFFKEIEFYKTVVRDVEKNLITENPTKWCPKYIYSKNYDFLVLENLCAQGYQLYPERMYFEMEHIVLSLQKMAAMHAGPMVLEQKLKDNKVTFKPKGWTPGNPANLSEIYKDIIFETECRNDFGHPGKEHYETGFKSQLTLIKLMPHLTKSQKDHILKVFPDLMHRIFSFVEPSKKFRNTFAQGDLWANNFLIRNDGNGKVDDIIIVDYQMTRFVPPALDIMLFLPQVQSRAFRCEHQEELINIYYEALSQEVKAEGYNVQDILPKTELDESCDFYYEFALLTHLMITQLTLTTPEMVKKFLTTPEQFDKIMKEDRSELLTEMFQTDQLFRTRVTESIDEAIAFYKLI